MTNTDTQRARMSDAEIGAIRARAEAALKPKQQHDGWGNYTVFLRILTTDVKECMDDIPRLCDELAAAREVIQHVWDWANDCHAGEDPDTLHPTGLYGFEDIEAMCANHLRGSTPDAGQRE